MLAVTSGDFHAAWNGMKAKTSTLDLAGWMRATTARNTHIHAWQLFFEDYPIVLAPTTVKPTPGPREDTISPERVREIFWNDLRFYFRDQRAWPAQRCRACNVAQRQADRRAVDRGALPRGPCA